MSQSRTLHRRITKGIAYREDTGEAYTYDFTRPPRRSLSRTKRNRRVVATWMVGPREYRYHATKGVRIGRP